MRIFVFLLLSVLSALAQSLNQIQVQSGASFSNSYVGGTIFSSAQSRTNCCAAGALTNLNSLTIPGNMLTNNGDSVSFLASGRFSTTGQSKRLVATYGSEDFMDTGLQAVSNGTWFIIGTITRVSPTQQRAIASLRWDRGVMGGGTNSSGLLSQTNGIDTNFRLQGAANVVASITNEALLVDWKPGPR